MHTYIVLLRWTQQGIENVRESPNRLEKAKETFRELGVQLKATYLLMGQYDLATILEAPDDESVTKAVLAISSRGAVRSETLRAYTEDEYRKIIAGLP
jgi:uncharacterized protein with GYD domain